MNKDMNNKIVGLRRTMFCIAAAVVSIGFTACSDEMYETQNATTSANGNVYKFSIPASMGKGDTRAITYNETTKEYDATFETTDLIEVYNVTKGAKSRKQSKYGGWDEVRLHPDASGKTANLVGELAFAVEHYDPWSFSEIAPEVGDELILFYNNNYQVSFGYDYWYEGNKPDFAMANAKIVSINDGLVKTSAASFENPQSLYKIKFTGIGSGVKIKKVIISSEQQKLVNTYAPADVERQNLFGDVTYTYEGEGVVQHEQIFMLRFADNPEKESSSGDVITFMVLGSNGHNYFGTKTVTTNLDNGKYYQADVAMTDAGLAMTLTNNTTGELVEVGESNNINTKDAAYTIANTGYNTSFSWSGGEKTITLKDVSIYNASSRCLGVMYDNSSSDPDIKVHNLVLDGVNTMSVTGSTGYNPCIDVQDGSSLNISATSTGKLILKIESEAPALNVWYNGKMTIESGEVTVDGRLQIGDNGYCVITNSGKLRVLTQKLKSTAGIKAASGYVLNTTTEDDYTVFTVSKAPDPIALSAVTSNDLGKIIGSDRNVYVPNYSFPDDIKPVAMIAYISSTGHGLAVAMESIRKYYGEGYRNGFTWDNSGDANDGKDATEIFNDWTTNNNVNFGTWRIPTKADCQNMILGCRIDGDATVASDVNMTSNGLRTKLVAAGICTDDYFGTWTNTSDGYGGEILFGMSKEDNGSFVSSFYNYNADSSSTIFPVLEF